ncbi:MAG: chitobiase/beta-hexosaminidase C-terminal domain-containing protein, partial [Spirochaetota bacterium]
MYHPRCDDFFYSQRECTYDRFRGLSRRHSGGWTRHGTYHHTTNRDDPTTSSAQYSAGFSASITRATTVKVFAVAAGYSSSALATAVYRDYYVIGDTGPAGGLICYAKESYSGTPSWRYLEATPTDLLTSDGKAFFTSELTYGLWGGPGTTIGTADSNTAVIVANNGTGGEYAARSCSELVLGGYDDWFPPSIDELHQMYLN